MQKHIAHDEGYRYDYVDEYRIKDLEIASSLVASGFEVIEIVPNRKGELWFVFDHTEELADAVESFWNETMKLSPLRFSTTRKNLKNRLFSIKNKR